MSDSGYVPIPPELPGAPVVPPGTPPVGAPLAGKYVPLPPTIEHAVPTVLLTNGLKLCPTCYGHGYLVPGPPLALCPTCNSMGSYHP